MCNVQGSAHYKMILVNYLEPPSIAWQVWTARKGCLPFSLSHQERRGQRRLGSALRGV